MDESDFSSEEIDSIEKVKENSDQGKIGGKDDGSYLQRLRSHLPFLNRFKKPADNPSLIFNPIEANNLKKLKYRYETGVIGGSQDTSSAPDVNVPLNDSLID